MTLSHNVYLYFECDCSVLLLLPAWGWCCSPCSVCFRSMLSCRWWLVIGRETDGAYVKMAPARAGFTPLFLTPNQTVLSSSVNLDLSADVLICCSYCKRSSRVRSLFCFYLFLLFMSRRQVVVKVVKITDCFVFCFGPTPILPWFINKSIQSFLRCAPVSPRADITGQSVYLYCEVVNFLENQLRNC